MLIYALLLLLVSIIICNCTVRSDKRQQAYLPLMPQAVYSLSPDSLPFRFEVSDQASFSSRKTKKGEYFCDVDYPALQAHLYCTWHEITPERFSQMAEESHKLAYQHSLMAETIQEKMYVNDSLKVYGILYDIAGNVATPVQVGLTDSVSFFFNASLYFNTTSTSDSIAPVLEYVRKDIRRMMETFTSNR